MKCIPYIILLFLLGCSDQSNINKLTTQNKIADTLYNVYPVTYDTSTVAVQVLKKHFRIEKEDGNGYFLQSYVYISDVSELREINKLLKARYINRHSEALDIWYFDKKNFVEKYLRSLENHNLSDDEFSIIDKHMICQYSELRGDDGLFDYNEK